MLDKVNALIDDAPWRKSTLKGNHEYVMQEVYPQLYQPIQTFLKEAGYRQINGPITTKVQFMNWNKVATPTRFELAISALTGPYVKPLHHGAAKKTNES